MRGKLFKCRRFCKQFGNLQQFTHRYSSRHILPGGLGPRICHRYFLGDLCNFDPHCSICIRGNGNQQYSGNCHRFHSGRGSVWRSYFSHIGYHDIILYRGQLQSFGSCIYSDSLRLICRLVQPYRISDCRTYQEYVAFPGPFRCPYAGRFIPSSISVPEKRTGCFIIRK